MAVAGLDQAVAREGQQPEGDQPVELAAEGQAEHPVEGLGQAAGLLRIDGEGGVADETADDGEDDAAGCEAVDADGGKQLPVPGGQPQALLEAAGEAVKELPDPGGDNAEADQADEDSAAG